MRKNREPFHGDGSFGLITNWYRAFCATRIFYNEKGTISSYPLVVPFLGRVHIKNLQQIIPHLAGLVNKSQPE